MEKVRNFVVKYQVWFKLAAIALLICVLFTPYVKIIDYHHNLNEQAAISFWHIVLNNRLDIKDKIFVSPNSYHQFPAYVFLGWSVFLLSLITIVFLLISIFKKKFLIVASLSYIVNFIIIFSSLIYSIYAYKNSIIFTDQMNCVPNIAFYLSLLLFLANIFILIMYLIPKFKWNKIHKPTKAEQIATLEKRIEQLEQERDGK